MPGLGTLPMEWLDLPMLSAALRRRQRAGAQTGRARAQYGERLATCGLRRVLSQRLGDFGL